MERNTFTNPDSVLYSVLLAAIRPGRVTYNSTPTGKPSTKPKKPETKVIMTVSHTPRAINQIIASDITQNLYFYLIFLQELNRCQRVFVAAVQLCQHHAEFNAAGVIHLGADDIVVDVETASSF